MRTFRRWMRFGDERNERGFSLIELGIVIMVISVMMVVVLLGRGFVVAARVTKAVEGANTVRKATSTLAGLQGGVLLEQCGLLAPLQTRALLPAAAADAGGWEVSGSGGDAIRITNICTGQLPDPAGTGAANVVSITFQAPNQPVGVDLMTSVRLDANLHVGAAVAGGAGGQPCMNPMDPATITDQPTMCFFL